MNSQPDHSHAVIQDDEISLGEIWHALTSRVLLISIVTLLCGAVAAAIAFTMTPIYQAEIVVTVVDDSKEGLGALANRFGGLISLNGGGSGGSSTRNESLGTLSSKQLVENYIRSKNLLPVLFYKQWDEKRGDWKSDLKKKPTLWQATELFIKNVRKVSDDKKSGLITLSVEWKDAVVATQWANDLVRLTNQTLRQRAINRSESNLAYLQEQLDKTSVVEIREAIFRLIESEVKNVMVAKGNDDFAFKVIDPAVVPEKKVKPKRALIVVGGIFIGLALSVFYVLVSYVARRERRDD